MEAFTSVKQEFCSADIFRVVGILPLAHCTFTPLVFDGSIFGMEDRELKNDMTMEEMLQLKESCSSFHNQDYVEKINEFQSYVDKVKRFTRPGCSTESLDVALSSMSSLVHTLSAMSSEQNIIHASL